MEKHKFFVYYHNGWTSREVSADNTGTSKCIGQAIGCMQKTDDKLGVGWTSRYNTLALGVLKECAIKKSPASGDGEHCKTAWY